MIKKSFLLVLNSALLITGSTQGLINVSENGEIDTNALNAAKVEETKPDTQGLTDQIFTERFAQLNSAIDLEFNQHVKKQILRMLSNKRHCEKFIKQSKDYFPVFDKIFAEKGIPAAIKSLAIVESNLDVQAESPKGALGLWQFMPKTAIDVGLIVDDTVDERLDVVASTQKAADYLKSLHKEFNNDWLLAIAAYNCGLGTVNKAIKKAGGEPDYWAIRQYLPKETQNYIPKFIATNYLIEYHSEHGIAPKKHKKAKNPSNQSLAFIDKDDLWVNMGKETMNLDNLQMLKPIFNDWRTTDADTYNDDKNRVPDELLAESSFLLDFDEPNQDSFKTLFSFN